MASFGIPWKLTKKGVPYVVPGRLQAIVSDGCHGANYAAMKVAKSFGIFTSGCCGHGPTPFERRLFNLQQILPAVEEVVCKRTGEIQMVTQSDRSLFIQRSIRHIKSCDGIVFVNLDKKFVISQLIGYAVVGRMVQLDNDYSPFPFYHWSAQRVFVVNAVTKATANNLRNFIILHKITSLCVIGDFDTKNYPLVPFFERAFRIRLDKAV